MNEEREQKKRIQTICETSTNFSNLISLAPSFEKCGISRVFFDLELNLKANMNHS